MMSRLIDLRPIRAALLGMSLWIVASPAARADDHEPADLLTTAARAGNFRTLVNAVVASGLTSELSGEGPFTIFAPTDEAFEKLPEGTLEQLLQPESRDALRAILTYHVLPSALHVAEEAPSHPVRSAETVNGARLKFRREGSDVRVNDANIVARNIVASNGVIQVIDAVLIPPSSKGEEEPEERDDTVVGVARAGGQFKTLLAALEAAGLDEALRGDGPFTVFAPTDEAFAKLGEETIAELLKDKAKLAGILQYHVIGREVSAREAVAIGTEKTLRGGEVRMRIRDGRLVINESNVVASDVKAGNGVIHVIDAVLMPECASE